MYTVVKWPHDMALGKVVNISRHPNIVSLNIVLNLVSRNGNQGYNSCIHQWWAMIKDKCCTRHHMIYMEMPGPRLYFHHVSNKLGSALIYLVLMGCILGFLCWRTLQSPDLHNVPF